MGHQIVIKKKGCYKLPLGVKQFALTVQKGAMKVTGQNMFHTVVSTLFYDSFKSCGKASLNLPHAKHQKSKYIPLTGVAVLRSRPGVISVSGEILFLKRSGLVRCIACKQIGFSKELLTTMT